ncbi:DNA alkylation repair protein [Herbiconiux sp. VKM Ac-2851]|uniref:DNA alkylation repair protein n=1 Tax=Herbiconiux sp. VKM Ac-2851 TaxID=2739025 RepID=UPI001567497A|nr:DNA alkylation repair protein [Herbiconiux sp. VKM Ac-2851]NQX37130.1 DNA alkylation repair protein [Herbiconiux sp. VKM Ac-2851]
MPFADELMGPHVAEALTRGITAALPEEELTNLRAAAAKLDGLALRERSDVLRNALLLDVPGSYAELDTVVRKAAQSPSFSGWLIWPVTSAVATRAVQEDTEVAFDSALELLAALTGGLSSEFAIRTLLRHDPQRALETMLVWTASPDEHVRRLASEGSRPYLPWSVRVPALIKSGGATIAILDALYLDESDYVRRSVANHLNDLSRDEPELVVATAARWLAEPDVHTPALARRALRTLIKRGDKGALALMGYQGVNITFGPPELEEIDIPFGGSIRFRATVQNHSSETARVAIDYVIHHRRNTGATTPKVFKLTTAEIAPGEAVKIERAHSFRAITTRRYYPGTHAIALQVNGITSPTTPFELLQPTGL